MPLTPGAELPKGWLKRLAVKGWLLEVATQARWMRKPDWHTGSLDSDRESIGSVRTTGIVVRMTRDLRHRG